MSRIEHNYDFYDFVLTNKFAKVAIFRYFHNLHNFHKICSSQWALQQISGGKYNKYDTSIPCSFNVSAEMTRAQKELRILWNYDNYKFSHFSCFLLSLKFKSKKGDKLQGWSSVSSRRVSNIMFLKFYQATSELVVVY